MAQRFLAPEVTFEGIVKQKGTVSDDQNLITRGYLHSNVTVSYTHLTLPTILLV